MEDYQNTNETSIFMSVTGIVVAIIIFTSVWFIGAILFYLFDSLRGLGNDKLQYVFRELFIPGVGGYVAMVAVDSWLSKSSLKLVFYGFSAAILIVVGIYIGFVGPLAGKIGEDFWGMLLSTLSIVASIVGAYIYAKEHMNNL